MRTDREASIAAIEQWAGSTLPSEYHQFLLSYDEGIFGDSILIYPAEAVLERNLTFETSTYCPGYIAIGDDSGGRAVVISLSGDPRSVFLVDHGDMDPNGFIAIADSFSAWVSSGCPVT